MLQWVGAFALVLLLGVAELLAALVREAHIHHILPVLGFLFGISSRALAGGFGRVGVALGATAALFGVSALEVFTARGSRNKAWAAFPWLFVGILAGAAAFVRPHPTRSVAAPGVEEVVRYTPTSSWVDSRAGRGIAAQLTAVELAGDRLTTRLSFVNMSAVPVRFHVHRGLNLKSGASGALATVEVFTPVGDDGRLAPDQWVVLAAYGRPGSSLEAAYYFLRPKNPYCHWRLYLAAHSGNDPTMLRWDDFFWVEPFEFDITDTASHG